jgi:hypothetical protein
MRSSAKIQFIFAVVLLALAVSAYGSWYAVVSSRSAQSAELATQIQSKGQDAKRLAEAKTALASISGDEATVRGYFVSTADVVSFLENLQALGSRLGTNVTIASVSADNTQSTRPTLALTLQIAGPFDAVLRTLGSIEYGPYFIEVSDFSLTTVPAIAAGAGAPARAAGWTATASFIVGALRAASSTPASAPAPAATETQS